MKEKKLSVKQIERLEMRIRRRQKEREIPIDQYVNKIIEKLNEVETDLMRLSGHTGHIESRFVADCFNNRLNSFKDLIDDVQSNKKLLQKGGD